MLEAVELKEVISLMLGRFFRPGWKHSKLEKRLVAVTRLSPSVTNEHAILFQVASHDSDAKVRAIATSKLLNLTWLNKISRVDPDGEVTKQANQRYNSLIAGTAECSTREIITGRYRIVDESDDPELLAYVVRHSPDIDLQFVALRKIADSDLIAEIAKSAPNGRIREAALKAHASTKAPARAKEPTISPPRLTTPAQSEDMAQHTRKPLSQPSKEPIIPIKQTSIFDKLQFNTQSSSLQLDNDSVNALHAVLDKQSTKRALAQTNPLPYSDTQKLADLIIRLNDKLSDWQNAVENGQLGEAHHASQEANALLAELSVEESSSLTKKARELQNRLDDLVTQEADTICEHVEALASHPVHSGTAKQLDRLLQSWRELPLSQAQEYYTRLEKARLLCEENISTNKNAAV